MTCPKNYNSSFHIKLGKVETLFYFFEKLVFALRARRTGRHLRQQFGERFQVKSINQVAKRLYRACPTLTFLCSAERCVHGVPKGVGTANRLSWRRGFTRIP